jgi:hypothetical protein
MRMRLILSSAHRRLHNQMHRNGVDHPHTAVHHPAPVTSRASASSRSSM